MEKCVVGHLWNRSTDHRDHSDLVGTVYLAHAKRSGRLKIGFSRDVMQRVKAVQSAQGEPVVLVGVLPNVSVRVEQVLHEVFRSQHLGEEWFEYDFELRSFVAWVHEHVPLGARDTENRLLAGRWIPGRLKFES